MTTLTSSAVVGALDRADCSVVGTAAPALAGDVRHDAAATALNWGHRPCHAGRSAVSASARIVS